jgi:all-trans-retinol 13,14-reductase
MKTANEVYDIIVIGSGMGGLTFASIMAQLANKRVLVLERHFKLGGYTHTFDRKGYRWDVGVHYVGQMAKDQRCRQFFDLITQGKVKWCRMPDKFDQFNYPDFDFSVDASPAVYKADLIKRFPEESVSISEYFEDVKTVQQWFEDQIFQSLLPLPLRWAMGIAGGAQRALATQTTQSYLDKKFKSIELKALLCSQWGDCGLPPSKSSFTMHSIIVSHYFGGAYYPLGSAKSIADAIVPIIKAHGGDCLVNHTVKGIIVEDGQAKGVTVKVDRGKTTEEITVMAPVVVSDAGHAITFGALVPPKYQVSLTAQVSADICSAITIYIGLKSDPQALGFKGENHWIFETYNHDFMFANTLASVDGKAGGCFLSFPSLKDPAAKRHTAEIIGFLKFDEFAKWSDTKWKHRGEDYEAFKQQLTKTLLELVERKYPGFSELIDYTELSTPLTVKSFTGHHEGAIYGYPSTAIEFSKRTFNPKTPIKNLYMTGADVVSLGIMGALMGGVVTASHMLGGFWGFTKILLAAKHLSKRLPLEPVISRPAAEPEKEPCTAIV